jgi:hypothetical protein
MQENDSCGKLIYICNVHILENVNTCVNTMHVGTMDRGFTVFTSDANLVAQQL